MAVRRLVVVAAALALLVATALLWAAGRLAWAFGVGLAAAPFLVALLLPVLQNLVADDLTQLWREWRARVRRARWALSNHPSALQRYPAPGPWGEEWQNPGRKTGQETAGPGPTMATLVWVEKGPFTMGSDGHDPDEGPAHQVTITQGFWLQRCPVTNRQYAEFLNERHMKGADTTRYSVLRCKEGEIEFDQQTRQYQPKSGRDGYPVVGVDWDGADEYARRYWMRLPTEAEWEYAARGRDAPVYPWGNRWQPSWCCCRENPGPPFDPYRGCVEGTGGPPYPYVESATQTRGLRESEELRLGRSRWSGALEMSGNIMEWCANWHYGYPLEASPEDDPCGPPTGTHRAVRGGNYCCDSNDCRASRRRHRSSPSLPETKANNSIGFRCVVDWKAVERLKAGTWKPPS